MRLKRIVSVLALGAALNAAAEDISLSGAVKDGTGTAIENAIVTLSSNSSLKDTTDAQGKFQISTATALRRGLKSGISSNVLNSVAIKGTSLRFSLSNPAGNDHTV